MILENNCHACRTVSFRPVHKTYSVKPTTKTKVTILTARSLFRLNSTYYDRVDIGMDDKNCITSGTGARLKLVFKIVFPFQPKPPPTNHQKTNLTRKIQKNKRSGIVQVVCVCSSCSVVDV